MKSQMVHAARTTCVHAYVNVVDRNPDFGDMDSLVKDLADFLDYFTLKEVFLFSTQDNIPSEGSVPDWFSFIHIYCLTSTILKRALTGNIVESNSKENVMQVYSKENIKPMPTLVRYHPRGKTLTFACIRVPGGSSGANFLISYETETEASGAVYDMQVALCDSLGCNLRYREEYTWRTKINGTVIGIAGAVFEATYDMVVSYS